MRHLESIGKMGTENGVIYMITATEQSKHTEKKYDERGSDLTHSFLSGTCSLSKDKRLY